MIRERNIWRKKLEESESVPSKKCSYFIVFRSSTSAQKQSRWFFSHRKVLKLESPLENELSGSRFAKHHYSSELSDFIHDLGFNDNGHFLLIFYEAWILFFTTALIDGSLERFFGGDANGWSCAAIHRWEFSTQKCWKRWWLSGGHPDPWKKKWSNLTGAYFANGLVKPPSWGVFSNISRVATVKNGDCFLLRPTNFRSKLRSMVILDKLGDASPPLNNLGNTAVSPQRSHPPPNWGKPRLSGFWLVALVDSHFACRKFWDATAADGGDADVPPKGTWYSILSKWSVR